MEAASLRRKEQAKRDLSLAWHTEAFARSKRLPDLEELFDKFDGTKTRKQSPQEIKDRIRAMTGSTPRRTVRKVKE